MKKIIILSILFTFALSKPLAPIDFDVVKEQTNTKSPTLLLMGGIQGDEPGGFNATNMFLMHYKIIDGNVWVVPVLNKHSMLMNHRGLYDDMNRKFKNLSSSDPEYFIIKHIEDLITDKEVNVILHLHDGSGFYRPKYETPLLNPNRWGNCSIIDQKKLENVKFGDLNTIVNKMTSHINDNLLEPIHKYYVRDTHTAKGDKEMEKALTYFAIRNKKPAFANEASKELSLEKRVYYHLLAIEGILDQVGIKYERDFKLTPNNIYRLINDKTLDVKINDSIILPLYGLRPVLNYFPMPKDAQITTIPLSSKAHIVGLLPRNNQVWLKYGNKLMTRINPDYIEFDHSVKNIQIKVDGELKNIEVPSIVEVKENFEILPIEGYRVNIIGYVIPNDKSKKPNETGILIHHKDCISKFSIDKAGKIFRAEIYKGDKFSGMILIKFL
ncbi:M99 family carboxypeptidase catalytic domain-containing protein [Helicobacter cappadocius]|uniref:M99 family carboxypeptidase catalytic domain-containing protein n=1 Tax=Helicobacter cappadocius TaxID=3063998 RepID=A0AA90PII8_9HELI|nr:MULTISPECIES: M99 family carboxypeptidase catalytic domain-containing protein [unclassified Helicobacter]MDO7252849.1 M99 family carboxypeptidase catalytic domain-containing protein [Helicobacter sp. faydin-H75]MDP2538892.1 M99 family carboxypeptidase catalytic domain-containing protein [Helicobacter sp. faydin-H76]